MLTLLEIKPNEDFSTSYEIRKTVFVEEQNIPIENEMDGLDPECFHIVLYDDAAPVGSGRLYNHDDIARREGAKVVTLDSQAYVASLYEKMEFIRDGDEFLEEGILHIKMNMELI